MSLDIEALYVEYERSIRGYIANRMGDADDALIQDIAADVWERAIKAAPRYQDRGIPHGVWLRRIASNRLIDHYRAQSCRPRVDRLGDIDPYAEHVGTSDHLARIDAEAIVPRALATLCTSQRDAVVARLMEGWSVPQTAREFGQTEEAVKALKARGLAKLRRVLEVG